MAFIEGALVIGENTERADGLVIGDEGTPQKEPVVRMGSMPSLRISVT